MTQDEIIRMAREAGISSVWAEASTRQLERFAALVAAPPRTKDLTDDEIALINLDYPYPQGFARAVIAADREKNK